ncbi:MAG: urea amidolyase associated protein UAAP1 [Verrucomicrobiota bacterium]
MDMLYEKDIVGGGMWSQVVGRGKTLTLTDLEGGANVGMLLYNADHPLERYNMPDTLKGQHIFFLTAPFCLHSDMGRLFAGISRDTMGWHDTVCGTTSKALVRRKYGEKSYQEARNDFHRDGQENFLIELGKWGLGKRDLVPNINWFSKVVSDEHGGLSYEEGASEAGAEVELMFEMNTLVVLHTCQHPLDPRPQYAPKPVCLRVAPSKVLGEDKEYVSSRPENERAYLNTEHYHALRS